MERRRSDFTRYPRAKQYQTFNLHRGKLSARKLSVGSTVPNFHQCVTQCQLEIFAWWHCALTETFCNGNFPDSSWLHCEWFSFPFWWMYLSIRSIPPWNTFCTWKVHLPYLDDINFAPAWYTFCTCMMYIDSGYTLLVQAKAQVYLNFLSAPGCTWLHTLPKYGQLPLVTIPDVNFLNDSC